MTVEGSAAGAGGGSAATGCTPIAAMFVAGATPRASGAVFAGTPIVSALARCAAEPGGLRSSVSSAAVSTAKRRVSVAPTTMPVVTPSFRQSTDSTATCSSSPRLSKGFRSATFALGRSPLIVTHASDAAANSLSAT